VADSTGPMEDPAFPIPQELWTSLDDLLIWRRTLSTP